GTPYERVTCRFGRMGREHFGKLGLGEEAVDAVAALHDDVAGTEVDRDEIDADDQLAAEAAGDDVPARVRPGILRRQDPVLDLLADPGVVLRELRQLALPEEEEPAVADVGAEERPADDRRRRDRRPHAAELGDRDALRVDLEVRLLDGTLEALRG